MPTDRVVIEEILLRLPGVSAQVARSVSAEVAQRLGQGLTEALPARSVGALEVRVTVRPGASRDEMVAAVAHAIIAGLVP